LHCSIAPLRCSACRRACSTVRGRSHPLVGESAFFDGSFYNGFWREPVFRGPDDQNPLGATHPPGKVVQPTLTSQANAATLARFKTPEACRYGDRCRHKLSCSRYHGTVRAQTVRSESQSGCGGS
jgi:hypothetical protein